MAIRTTSDLAKMMVGRDVELNVRRENTNMGEEFFRTLLISQSAGSAYESFVDQLIEEEEKQTYTFQQEMIRQGYSCRPLTLDEIHILLSAQYYAFFEIVRHKLEKDEALDRIHLIADFFGSAWKLYFA